MGVNDRKNSGFIIIGVGVVLALIFIFQLVLNDDEYMIEMRRYRDKRAEMFKNPDDSPLPDSLIAQFPGVEYFPIERKWRISGKWKKNPKFEKIEVPRTARGPEEYIVAGWVNFKVNGKMQKLTAYQTNPNDSKTLFVPFRDATTSKTTYGGGRYIDTRLANDRVMLDFNKAYNPFCVYNFDYACPIPPEENTLKIAVEAGEKDFKWAGE